MYEPQYKHTYMHTYVQEKYTSVELTQAHPNHFQVQLHWISGIMVKTTHHQGSICNVYVGLSLYQTL